MQNSFQANITNELRESHQYENKVMANLASKEQVKIIS